VSKRDKYGAWKEEMMEQAIMAYRNRFKCDFQNVKATLKRRVDGGNINAFYHDQAFGRSVDLLKEIEDELSKHVLLLEERFFGLTRNDLRRLAFQVAETNNLPHRFDLEKEMAGDKWYCGFISCRAEISLRHPEPTSIARAEGFNKERVK
jgi:hypothetical protein